MRGERDYLDRRPVGITQAESRMLGMRARAHYIYQEKKWSWCGWKFT